MKNEYSYILNTVYVCEIHDRIIFYNNNVLWMKVPYKLMNKLLSLNMTFIDCECDKCDKEWFMDDSKIVKIH